MEFPVRRRVHPHRTVNHRVLASVLIEWGQHSDIPARTRLYLIHDEPVNEPFHLRIAFEVIPDTFTIHSFPFIFAKIRRFVDSSKYFLTFLDLFAFCLYKESHKQEVDGRTDSVHWPWCPDFIHSDPDKEIKQQGLNAPVHQVTESESFSSLLVGFDLKSEICS